MQILVSKSVHTFDHLSKLHQYRASIMEYPELFKQDAQEWLDKEIGEIEKELFAVEKEIATGQGVYSFKHQASVRISIVPVWKLEGKGHCHVSNATFNLTLIKA